MCRSFIYFASRLAQINYLHLDLYIHREFQVTVLSVTMNDRDKMKWQKLKKKQQNELYKYVANGKCSCYIKMSSQLYKSLRFCFNSSDFGGGPLQIMQFNLINVIKIRTNQHQPERKRIFSWQKKEEKFGHLISLVFVSHWIAFWLERNQSECYSICVRDN